MSGKKEGSETILSFASVFPLYVEPLSLSPILILGVL